MQVTDFRWTNRYPPGRKPDKPIIYNPHLQKSPPAGAFAILVSAAITDSLPDRDFRHFSCSVEVEANENKPGVQDAIKALLVKECLARWEVA